MKIELELLEALHVWGADVGNWLSFWGALLGSVISAFVALWIVNYQTKKSDRRTWRLFELERQNSIALQIRDEKIKKLESSAQGIKDVMFRFTHACANESAKLESAKEIDYPVEEIKGILHLLNCIFTECIVYYPDFADETTNITISLSDFSREYSSFIRAHGPSIKDKFDSSVDSIYDQMADLNRKILKELRDTVLEAVPYPQQN